MQPLAVSRVQLLYTVKEIGENLIENNTPFPCLRLRIPNIKLNSENSQDYAQKPQQNSMFMNSASAGECFWKMYPVLL
jgi:hypothetical protein